MTGNLHNQARHINSVSGLIIFTSFAAYIGLILKIIGLILVYLAVNLYFSRKHTSKVRIPALDIFLCAASFYVTALAIFMIGFGMYDLIVSNGGLEVLGAFIAFPVYAILAVVFHYIAKKRIAAELQKPLSDTDVQASYQELNGALMINMYLAIPVVLGLVALFIVRPGQ